MSESDTWASVRPFLTHLDPQRLEVFLKVGVSDVECILGWIELKYVAAWPKRPTTPLKIRHFTPEQRTFLTRRCRINRAFKRPIGAWVLLQVADDFILLAGDVAAALIGRVTRPKLLAAALWHAVGSPNIGLAKALGSP